MAVFPVANVPLAGSIESTIRQGAQAGYIADADLATNLATVLANIDTRAAKKPKSEWPIGVLALKEAVKYGYSLLGSAVFTGGALADIYAACPGTWGVGFGVTV